jgi:hypothetical protein
MDLATDTVGKSEFPLQAESAENATGAVVIAAKAANTTISLRIFPSMPPVLGSAHIRRTTASFVAKRGGQPADRR